MKTRRIILAYVTILCAAVSAQAQGTFQNLDFEAATVPTIPPGQFGSPVAITNGLPGWNGFIGGAAQSEVWHNNVSLGAPILAILGPDFPFGRIDGGFSALLTGSFQPVSISQDGTVPALSQSLTFKAIPGNGGFSVSLAGSALQVVQLQVTPSYTYYGCDVSGFAGQPEELTFTALATASGLNNFYLDSIQFSNQPVPEPNVFALSALGASLIGWHVLRRRQR
jgi:hypothetical protein